jgi:hypothetical protein
VVRMVNQTREHPSTILAKDSQDNVIATATASAGQNQSRYIITGVDASYSVASTSGLLQLKDGGTVVHEQYVHGSLEITFPSAIIGSKNTDFSAVLAASGTAGQVGKVNLRGYLGY